MSEQPQTLDFAVGQYFQHTKNKALAAIASIERDEIYLTYLFRATGDVLLECDRPVSLTWSQECLRRGAIRQVEYGK